MGKRRPWLSNAGYNQALDKASEQANNTQLPLSWDDINQLSGNPLRQDDEIYWDPTDDLPDYGIDGYPLREVGKNEDSDSRYRLMEEIWSEELEGAHLSNEVENEEEEIVTFPPKIPDHEVNQAMYSGRFKEFGTEEQEIVIFPEKIPDYEVNEEIFGGGFKESVSLFKNLFKIPQLVVTGEEMREYDGYSSRHLIRVETSEAGRVMWATCSVLEAYKRLCYVYDQEKVHNALYSSGAEHDLLMEDLEVAAKHSAAAHFGKFVDGEPVITRDDIEDSLDRLMQLEQSLMRIAGFSYLGESGAHQVEQLVRKIIWQKWDPSYTDFHIRYFFGYIMASEFYDYQKMTGEKLSYSRAKERVLINSGDIANIDELPYLYRQFLSHLGYLRYSEGRRKPERIRDMSRFMPSSVVEQYERDFGAIDDYPRADFTTRTVQIVKDELLDLLYLEGEERERANRSGPRELLRKVLISRGYEPQYFFERFDAIMKDELADSTHLGENVDLPRIRKLIAEEYGEDLVRAIMKLGDVEQKVGVDEAFRNACRNFPYEQLVQFAYSLDRDLAVVFMHRIGCFLDHHGYGEDTSLSQEREEIHIFTSMCGFSKSTYYRRLRRVIALLEEHEPYPFDPTEELDLHTYSSALKKEMWREKLGFSF